MYLVLLSVMLNCPDTVIVNTSKLKWNDHDQQTLVGAKKRCGEIYEDAPCLKWFKKYDFQQYSAICGAETK